MKILEGIADGIGAQTVEHLDLTPPETVSQYYPKIIKTLTLIGVPVYGGRVPAEAVDRLRQVKANDAFSVIVVVYGNRAYEDALLELKNLSLKAGFTPIAGGAFIGEHSFSNQETPIAVRRPDSSDLKKAREFGRMIRKKLDPMQAESGSMPPLTVPGSFPYRERPRPPRIAPITLETLCTTCGTCASVCPTAAITASDVILTNADACIRCCACVKNCPATARVMTDERIQEIRKRLLTNCSVRKEPEIFV